MCSYGHQKKRGAINKISCAQEQALLYLNNILKALLYPQRGLLHSTFLPGISLNSFNTSSTHCWLIIAFECLLIDIELSMKCGWVLDFVLHIDLNLYLIKDVEKVIYCLILFLKIFSKEYLYEIAILNLNNIIFII